MAYKRTPEMECLFTHITYIRPVTTMYALMSYQIILATESLITHFTNIRTLTTMLTLMQYQFAFATECLTTNITTIWMLAPMYITGIAAFSTVYMKLFIYRTLIKTQSLNITIYSDRKNNYFYNIEYLLTPWSRVLLEKQTGFAASQ